jgi:hypothetical protein
VGTNDSEVIKAMENLRLMGADLPHHVRVAMTGVLGELPALATIAYTGVVEDGDIKSFIRRTEELFGPNAETVLRSIVSSMKQRVASA